MGPTAPTLRTSKNPLLGVASGTIVSAPSKTTEVLRTRVVELDGLRGVAILLVVLWHYFFGWFFNWSTVQPNVSLWVLPFGMTWSGVDLFFVLSGFLLTNILLDARGSSNYFKVFYLRRAFRILPLYWVVLISFVVVRAAGVSNPTDTIPHWAYMVFAQNIFGALQGTFGAWWMGVTWSLAIEEQFYLVLPFLVRRLSVRSVTVVAIIAILAAPLLRALILLKWPGVDGVNWHAVYFSLPCRADSLACGVLAAIVLRNGLFSTFAIKKWRPYGLLGLLASLNLWQLIAGWDMRTVRSGVFGFSSVALFYMVLLLVAVSHLSSGLDRILRNRILIELGSLSYAIYLLHGIVLGLAHRRLLGESPNGITTAQVMVNLAALAVTIIMAMLSRRYIESPAMKIARSFKY